MMDQFNMQAQATDGSTQLGSQHEAEELCARLLQTTAELISVLDRETVVLRKGETQEMNALVARKTALSTALMRDMTVLNANASFISRVVPEQLAALKDQHQQFQRSLKVNHDALGAVKAITENLMRTIANAAGANKAAPDTYGRSATLSADSGNRTAALSVNRSL
jgi:hypothetical protein